jgi:hypothetical protein
MMSCSILDDLGVVEGGRPNQIVGPDDDPSPLLIRFFRAVTRARAAAGDARLRQIEDWSSAGQVRNT